MISSLGNLLPNVDFPFVYLHNEMVKYFQERDKRMEEQRQVWMQKLRHLSDGGTGELLEGLDGQMMSDRIFAQRNAVTRLESSGFRVGYVLAERFSKDLPRFSNELDKMKFICKEFWASTFGKGVDKLSTNHQGIYIIQDNKFHTVVSFSEGTQYLADSIPYLAFPAGIVRGALESLGLLATVTVQVEKMPVVKFSIQLEKT
ncbi:hypothetical protein GPALN_001870 [Globodera pallida]|uniref:Trafficking protein particle complex subunit 6B n=1 Tax=Globodera pallida TaxID=36090 RepID=A0A183BS04_GLOPA|nr:hypothetical protein GPALN_001870 [Globodera pallida]